MDMASAADVYAEQLISKRYGMPLWQPELPNIREALIGDVGFLQNGCSRRLFSATKPRDDPVNQHYVVPADFNPLQCNETALLHTVDCHLLPGPLHNSSIACTRGSGSITS
jgi:hypothetical protein